MDHSNAIKNDTLSQDCLLDLIVYFLLSELDLAVYLDKTSHCR